jgi:tetratricopeptide (TPR) repeat protein
LLLLNRDYDALESYEQALRLRPNDADAHYGMSFALLRLGELKRGFQEYEWRWQRAELASYRRDLGRPMWLGKAPLEGKALLVHAEQGLGDTIQFVRYMAALAKSGAERVSFWRYSRRSSRRWRISQEFL